MIYQRNSTLGLSRRRHNLEDVDETRNSDYDFCSVSPTRSSELIGDAAASVCRAEDKKVQDQAKMLLSTIQKYIDTLQNRGADLSHLPPLHTAHLETGGVLIEWIFPDFRVGFSIEPDPTDSSWYLVSNKRLDQESGSGHLSSTNFDQIVVRLLGFILSNS